MSIILKSGDGSELAHVSANGALKVYLDGADPLQAGYAKLLDSNGQPILTTENGALDVSSDALVLYEQVDGNNLNTNVWTTSVSGMAVTQASGFIAIGNTMVANNYAILQSIKSIPLYGHLPLKATFNIAVDCSPQANITMEIGIGAVTGANAAADGVFFRWSSNGEFRGVVNNGGSETSTPVLVAPGIFDVTLLDIIIVESGAQFLVDDEIVGEIDIPPAQAFPTSAGRLPIFARVYNGTSAPAVAPILYVGQVVVTQQAMVQNKPWDEVLVGIGRGAYQSPLTTFGQTANHANSTNPASATLSNTAAGYTTLGGRYQFAAVAGAVTDYALFAYQVPAGFQLFLKRARISCINTGAAVGLTATVLDWALGLNSSGVSLATADSPPTSWAPRRIPLGVQGFSTLSAIGVTGDPIDIDFNSPVCVDGGRYLHVILQVPVGAATGSEIFRGDVVLNGYFE